MKNYISYILFCLLAAFVQPAVAQRSIETKSQPDFPALPYTLTYTATPTGGSVTVSTSDNQSATSNTTIYNGTLVTLVTLPAEKYKPVAGYPKASKTGDKTTSVALSPVSNQAGAYTFTMPSFPVTIDMQYEAKSTNANLSGLTYKAGDTEVPVPGFSADKTSYDITLPDDTDPNTVITLSGTKEHESALLPATNPSVTLSDGKGSVTLTVTAEDGTEQTYTLNFAVSKYAVNFETPANGKLYLTSNGETITNGSTLFKGTTVTLETAPNAGYTAKLGYPAVYFLQEGMKKQCPFEVANGIRTFTMPSFPITIEMEYTGMPGNDARLKSLNYKIGDGEAIPVAGFNSGKTSCLVILPYGTASDATLEFISECTDSRAVVASTPQVLTLSDGKGSLKLVVTANDRNTKQEYTFDFIVAKENTYIVTLNNNTEGGTISATYSENGKIKVLKSGDAVVQNTELTLGNIPLPGYQFESYTGETVSGNKTTITKATVLSATFTRKAGDLPGIIGTEAIPAIPDEDPLPQPDAPIVIIPDAGALPSDTELSELRLIKDEPTADNIAKVEEQIRNENLSAENTEIMEIILVKITTLIDSNSGETTDIKITPIQPSGKVKIRIPYPNGTNKDSYEFSIIHLKSDGTTELYTIRNRGLLLADSYIELTVNSFSPFGIIYKKKSNPVIPTIYHTVTIPETEGIILDKAFGNYSVEEGSAFSFSLTLKDGYQMHSKPIVTTNESDEPIEPCRSDGKYVIKNICSDLTLIFGGILKDDTTVSNASITSGICVRTSGNTLHISTDHPEKVNIYTLTGKLKQHLDISAGDTQYTLPGGIYLIETGEKVFKVLIK